MSAAGRLALPSRTCPGHVLSHPVDNSVPTCCWRIPAGPSAGLKGFAKMLLLGFLGCPIFAEDLVFELFSIVLPRYFLALFIISRSGFLLSLYPLEVGMR